MSRSKASAARRSVPVRPASPGDGRHAGEPRAARNGSLGAVANASSAWRAALGAGAGDQCRAALDGASGVVSNSSSASSTADLPSTSAWWILNSSPTRPSSSSGARWMCHSGPVAAQRPRQRRVGQLAEIGGGEPAPSPSSVTWRRTSNSGSSTHVGSVTAQRECARRWRKRGTRCSRLSPSPSAARRVGRGADPRAAGRARSTPRACARSASRPAGRSRRGASAGCASQRSFAARRPCLSPAVPNCEHFARRSNAGGPRPKPPVAAFDRREKSGGEIFSRVQRRAGLRFLAWQRSSNCDLRVGARGVRRNHSHAKESLEGGALRRPRGAGPACRGWGPGRATQDRRRDVRA